MPEASSASTSGPGGSVRVSMTWGFAAPQRLDVAHQLQRVAHAGPDARPAAPGGGEPFHFARGEVENVDDRARHVEQLAQRLDHRRGDGVGSLLGRDRAVDLAQDAAGA